MAIPSLQDLPNIYKSEWAKFDELTKTYPITTTGAYSFTMASSGVTYSTVNGGLLDIFTQLQTVLLPYILNANRWNSIQSEIDNYVLGSKNDLQETRALIERQLGYDLWINQTGYGAYSIFDNTSDGVIDTANTTASIDTSTRTCGFNSTGTQLLKFTSHSYLNQFSKILCRINANYNTAQPIQTYTNTSNITVLSPNYILTTSDKIYITSATTSSKKEVAITSTTPVSNIYDLTTPVQTLTTSYSLSSTNNKNKSYILSNGKHVFANRNGANIIFYISDQTGQNFSELTTWFSVGGVFDYVVIGNTIYAFGGTTTQQNLLFTSFDATTVGNSVSTLGTIFNNQNSFGAYICAESNDGNLPITIVTTSKNSTYPNSFNLISIKTTDGLNFTKQNGLSGIDQITTSNTSGADYGRGYIQYMSNGLPIIFGQFNQSGVSNKISSFRYTTAWQSEIIVFDGGTTYVQSAPSSTLQKFGTNSGRLWCACSGTDATFTSNAQIKIKYSDNLGVTWVNGGVSAENVTTVSTLAQSGDISLSSDLSGNLYVSWLGRNATFTTVDNLRYIKRSNAGSYGTITEVSNSATNQSILYNAKYYNFDSPILTWRTNAITPSTISTYGKWTLTGFYNITTNENVITSASDNVPITTQYSITQNSTPFIFDSFINNAYLQYSVSGLNTNVSNLTVQGKSTVAKAVGYSVY